MYCRNCGKELQNDAAFCIHCGANQNGDTSPVSTGGQPSDNGKRNIRQSWAFGISGVTSPVLFILSMLSPREEREFFKGWKGRVYESVIPDNIKAALFVLLGLACIVSVILNITAQKPKSGRKSAFIWVMLVLNIFIGYEIITMTL